jgi:hypothetical protein
MSWRAQQGMHKPGVARFGADVEEP